jgi:hypothetical protein
LTVAVVSSFLIGGGGFHVQRNVVLQHGVARARFREECIGENGGLREGLREIQTGRADPFLRSLPEHPRRYDAVVCIYLTYFFRAQLPIARADLPGQFRIGRIDEFVPKAGGGARLILEAVE